MFLYILKSLKTTNTVLQLRVAALNLYFAKDLIFFFNVERYNSPVILNHRIETYLYFSDKLSLMLKHYCNLSILAINTAGVIAGAILGTLLGLALLAFLVICCCKKHREKKYEKEVHHEIR